MVKCPSLKLIGSSPDPFVNRYKLSKFLSQCFIGSQSVRFEEQTEVGSIQFGEMIVMMIMQMGESSFGTNEFFCRGSSFL